MSPEYWDYRYAPYLTHSSHFTQEDQLLFFFYEVLSEYYKQLGSVINLEKQGGSRYHFLLYPKKLGNLNQLFARYITQQV